MNEEEARITKLLTDAHNAFVVLEMTHPSDINDWVNGIHELQKIIGMRILRRDYPETYPTIN
ncbi:hypothetical protein FNO01nite_30400 [Flavobacterium noncentrifugens]|uniref:hypothetical protein n=1 Tax=Flavobacterium noncentrifugens TaxID=1128970 RepID=UPI000B874250|nr:hypothetical protein [Flavobacterium noncentrifugens]GEP52368.1 hypothetical protein FNO01nite_30400 [Flavobacterium noncentrifugens]